MSACAEVVRPKVATTALQSLIHFMTQSLLPLGFGFRGPSPSVGDVPAKCFFVGPRASDLVRKSRLPGDARRVIPSYRPQSRRLRRQNVLTTQGALSCGPCWARVPTQ